MLDYWFHMMGDNYYVAPCEVRELGDMDQREDGSWTARVDSDG